MPEVVLATFNAHAGVRPRSLPELRSLLSRRPSGAGSSGRTGSARALSSSGGGGGEPENETAPGVRSSSLDGPFSRVGGPETFDLAGAIASLDADIVVVQEAFRPDSGDSPLDEVAAGLAYELHEVSFGRAALEPWPHISSNGTGHVGLAVLSRFPVRRHRALPVRPVPFDPAPSRQALHLEVDVGGVPLDVVGVHLTSRLPHGPPMQLHHLRPRLPHAGRRAVVAGDFNFWGPAVATIAEGWQRAVRGPTWPAHRPYTQIDHVLVRHGIDVLAGEVLDDVGSDHRPVRVRLRVPT